MSQQHWKEDDNDSAFELSFEDVPLIFTQDIHKRKPAAELFVLMRCVSVGVFSLKSGCQGAGPSSGTVDHKAPQVQDARIQRFFGISTKVPAKVQDLLARLVIGAKGGFFGEGEVKQAKDVVSLPEFPLSPLN